MNSNVTYFFGLLLAVILQVLLFNHLPLLGGIVFVYLIGLMKMPYVYNRNFQVVLGFLIGLLVDIFTNTHGMHSLAGCTIMLLRNPILRLYNKDINISSVNIPSIGIQDYTRFAITIIVVHVLLLYFIEAFTLFNFSVIIIKVLISVVLTWIFAMILEFATMKR